MTDEQIIKAFEVYYEQDNDMLLTKEVKKAILDLIKRQQAEIERYKTLYEDLKAENLETIKAIKDYKYKTEAVKDFVHYFFDECVTFDNGVTLLVDKQDFDNLVKELTEGSK